MAKNFYARIYCTYPAIELFEQAHSALFNRDPIGTKVSANISVAGVNILKSETLVCAQYRAIEIHLKGTFLSDAGKRGFYKYINQMQHAEYYELRTLNNSTVSYLGFYCPAGKVQERDASLCGPEARHQRQQISLA